MRRNKIQIVRGKGARMRSPLEKMFERLCLILPDRIVLNGMLGKSEKGMRSRATHDLRAN